METQETRAAAALATVREFNRAFAANDPARYFEFIDEGLTLFTPSSPCRVDGRAADREEFEFSLRTGATRVNFFQELGPSVQVCGDTAIVTYVSRGSYGDGERTGLRYLKETDVLAFRDDRWRIVHIHVSA